MPPKDERNPTSHNEVGRKLLAAVLSEQLRIRSVDYTLRYYVPETVDPYWCELGWKLQCELAESAGCRLQEAVQRQRRKQIHLVVDNTNLPF